MALSISHGAAYGGANVFETKEKDVAAFRARTSAPTDLRTHPFSAHIRQIKGHKASLDHIAFGRSMTFFFILYLHVEKMSIADHAQKASFSEKHCTFCSYCLNFAEKTRKKYKNPVSSLMA